MRKSFYSALILLLSQRCKHVFYAAFGKVGLELWPESYMFGVENTHVQYSDDDIGEDVVPTASIPTSTVLRGLFSDLRGISIPGKYHSEFNVFGIAKRTSVNARASRKAVNLRIN